MDFIAHSREDIPVLLDEVERLQNANSALESDKINDEMNLEHLTAKLDYIIAENAKLREKQTPKMVTHEATLLRSFTCPTCKNVVNKFMEDNGKRVRVQEQYCQFCGQVLKWEG